MLIDAGALPHFDMEQFSRHLLGQYENYLRNPTQYYTEENESKFARCILKLLEAGFDLYFPWNTITVVARSQNYFILNRNQLQPADLSRYSSKVAFINHNHRNPHSLYRSAAIVIRALAATSHVEGHLKVKLDCLPLPNLIKYQLSLSHISSLEDDVMLI